MSEAKTMSSRISVEGVTGQKGIVLDKPLIPDKLDDIAINT
jgi:hypothetical protein